MTRRKTLSAILALALVAFPVVMASLASVEAAKLTDVQDIVSDSGIGADSDHEISFNATSGIAAGNTIVIKFDDTGNAYDLSTILLADIDMAKGTCGSEADVTLAAAPAGTTWGAVVNTTEDEITFTSGSDTVNAGDCVVVEIGTNAGGSNQITNPGAGVYDLDVVTTSDTGVTKLAVLSHVTADVTVDETLTFTVAGLTGAACTGGTGTTDTSATSISFGSVNADTFYGGCQSLTTSTNASGGYSVTVQQDGPLTSAALDTIAAGSCDSGCTVTGGTAWATASNNGFGYRVEDLSGTDGVETGASNFRLIGTIGTDTPEVVMSNVGVVSGSSVEVFYKISIDGAQEAGTYENEIVYVATPTY